jgi:hypothetical protein
LQKTALMSERRQAQGLDKLREARHAMTSARFALAANDSSAEAHLLAAAEGYWSAMNWLEGAEGFDTAHEEIHEVGRTIRANYAGSMCKLGPRDDGSFSHRCPVFLCHKRFGMSIGATSDSICSICYTDASECPHIPGESYEVVSSNDPWCNVCGKTKCSTHEVGTRYDTEAGMVVTNAVLHEVSIVARPAMPDARIREIPIDADAVEAAIGHLPPHAYLKCDKCLDPCQGFDSLGD